MNPNFMFNKFGDLRWEGKDGKMILFSGEGGARRYMKKKYFLFVISTIWDMGAMY